MVVGAVRLAVQPVPRVCAKLGGHARTTLHLESPVYNVWHTVLLSSAAANEKVVCWHTQKYFMLATL